jgi:putative transposase
MAATVSRTADRWYVAIRVDVADASRKRTGDDFAGVDIGIKNAATITTKNGQTTKFEAIEAPRPLQKSLRKLRRMQRSISRRKKGGSNRLKLVRQVARLHARIAFIRKDFWDKITSRLCRENQAVGIEDLNTQGLVRNRHLSRALSDVGFGEFGRQMRYKAPLHGTRLVIADRWYPSSKTCGKCSHVKESLSLAERVFHCDQCGHTEDRDVNASGNLCALAENFIPAACGEITPGDSGAVRPLDEPGTKPCGQMDVRTN